MIIKSMCILSGLIVGVIVALVIISSSAAEKSERTIEEADRIIAKYQSFGPISEQETVSLSYSEYKAEIESEKETNKPYSTPPCWIPNINDLPETELTAELGIIWWNGHTETYYSETVLPGGGLEIPGRHTTSDGLVRDEDEYICVATDWAWLPKGSVIETSLGMAKVYDTGAEFGDVDIYCNWE